MFDQLRDYDPDGEDQPRVFETVRLKGVLNERKGDVIEPKCEVHVYEAYWADLSRLSKGVWAFFGELYQLLLHFPSLGRNTVDYARVEDDGPLWRPFSWFHRWSVRWLTLFIVVLNLVLASLILPLMAPWLTRPPEESKTTAFGALGSCCRLAPVDARVPGDRTLVEAAVDAKLPSVRDMVTEIVLAFLLLTATALALLHRKPRLFAWIVAPLAAAGAGVGIAYWINGRAWGSGRLLVSEAWFVSALLIVAALWKYETMRRGAFIVGLIALTATGGALLWFLHEINGVSLLVEQDALRNALTAAVLNTLQYVILALQIAWAIHLLWLLITIVLGWLCAMTAGSGWKGKAWNTTWTARTTLTLSTALFANMTLAIWAALFKGIQKMLPGGAFTPRQMWGCLDRLFCLNRATLTPAAWIEYTLTASASFVFIAITVVFAFFVIVALWSILPSIVAEIKPPKKYDEHRRTNTRMRALGVWLTRGLDAIPAVAELFAILLIFVLSIFWRQTLDCAPPHDSSWTAISAAGALLAALIGARFWLPGASAALDVMLDVDNYLRQHPKKSTPRARIAERCSSVLRFILNSRECGHDYSSVVIIAHSQGTVITADLLRFLRHANDPLSENLESKRLALFTMGNPLMQLYARAFPGLYAWVWDGLNPQDLGVVKWVNAYCSGDYVGRVIAGVVDESRWDRRKSNPQNDLTPDVTTSATGIVEMCIGEGAHTHYWDQHGGDIAIQLDTLIEERC
jgi:hypothetical protein